MAAIVEPEKIGALLRSIEGYCGEPVTCLALTLIPYLFVRPIEFRTMEWDDVELFGPTPEWRIPWRRMKLRQPHIVPLSRQAAEILREGNRRRRPRWTHFNTSILNGRCRSKRRQSRRYGPSLR